MLPENFTEPAGFQWGHFNDAKGRDVRYGHIKAEGESKGTVVIGPGFRENVEKYFEVVRDMTKRGFDVYAIDWPGQGGSERLIKGSQKAHHEGYDDQIAALHELTQNVIPSSAKKPLMLMAHSMGAHIGLRYLKEHDGVFDSAILSSPMLDIVTTGVPKKLARQMAKFAKAGNYLEKYVPGGTDWVEQPFKDNKKTSDPVRFEAEQELLRTNKALQIGEPTYGWVYHTFSSIDILNDEDYLKAIKTPILMEVSGNEQIVDRAAQDRALTFLPNVRKVEIADARHEIWMERDELRDKWLDKVDAFMAERLAAQKLDAGPASKKSNPPGKPRPPAP